MTWIITLRGQYWPLICKKTDFHKFHFQVIIMFPYKYPTLGVLHYSGRGPWLGVYIYYSSQNEFINYLV